MIRCAVDQDIPRLVVMGQDFYQMTALHEIGVPYDADSMKLTFENLMGSADAALFVAEVCGVVVGVVGAVAVPLFTNHSVKSANEFFWYIDPAYRGTRTSLRLYRALEQWAEQKGVAVFCMGALKDSPKSVREFYSKTGLVEAETNYMKRLR
jgi:hypothetical protein